MRYRWTCSKARRRFCTSQFLTGRKPDPASLLGSMLVFRPGKGRLAVMAAEDAAFIERIARSGMAGEALDVEL